MGLSATGVNPARPRCQGELEDTEPPRAGVDAGARAARAAKQALIEPRRPRAGRVVV